MGEICSKWTIKTPERRQGSRSSVATVNFEQTSHVTLAYISEQVNVGWDSVQQISFGF